VQNLISGGFNVSISSPGAPMQPTVMAISVAGDASSISITHPSLPATGATVTTGFYLGSHPISGNNQILANIRVFLPLQASVGQTYTVKISNADFTDSNLNAVPTTVTHGSLNVIKSSDLLFTDSANTVYVGSAAGNQPAALQTLGSPGLGWMFKGTGDFNHDGKMDILFQNAISGAVGFWAMNGRSVTGWQTMGQPAAGFLASAVGDMNKDGSPDVLFQNILTGEIRAWMWDNVRARVISDQKIGQPALGWKIRSAGDLDHDGYSDLLLYSLTHKYALWFWDGAQLKSEWTLDAAKFRSSILAMGDWNHDGYTDVCFQNGANGMTSLLLGNSGPVTEWMDWVTAGQLPAGRQIVGALN
jgi:hypothetical protein